MKIVTIRMVPTSFWGGDLKAIEAIQQGFAQLGHEVQLAASVAEAGDADLLFLTSSCMDLRPEYHLLQLQSRPYSLIALHEDEIRYRGLSWGFFYYVHQLLNGQTHADIAFALDRLIETPTVIHYFVTPPRPCALINYEVIRDADVCIANSHPEKATLQRDCPSCNVQVVRLPPGFAEEFPEEAPPDFLEYTGLKSGEYILQIGRMQLRKNQLATILATRDLPMPLVLISTKPPHPWYEVACLKAILRWRRAPTLVISETIPAMQEGPLRILSMPHGTKLSSRMLHSAIAHAGLHLHPAFCELPGYTYLESAKLGVPTVASSWATVHDYFTDPITQSYTLDDRIVYGLPYDVANLTELVQKQWGRSFSKHPPHPAFTRTSKDTAREILALHNA